MSPSGGEMTTVEPCMMWSPEKSRPSSTSRKQRWFEAWPGVCRARSSYSSVAHRVAVGQGAGDRQPVTAGEGEHLGAGAARHLVGGGPVVDVGVGAHDPADAIAARAR